MPSETLTDRRIRAIEPPTEGRLEIWDKGEPGLILRVSPTGAKSWAVQWKGDVFDGAGRRKTRKLTLGGYRERDGEADKLSLAEARKQARIAKGAVAIGEDPAAAKAGYRAAAVDAGKRANAATVAEAVEVFAELSAKSPSKWKRYERPRILRREIVDRLGRRGIGEVTAEHLDRIQEEIRKRPAPILANRFAFAARVFFGWAADKYQIDNPAERLSMVTEEADYRRDRTLTLRELRAIWAAAAELTPVARDFVRVLMIVPQRESAVAAMQFSQIEGGVWTIPRRQKKQKTSPQALPLSDAAAVIINGRPREFEHVFCSGRAGDKPLQAFSQIKRALDRALGEGMAPWRFHDFRRSFRTWAAASRIDQAVARKILDHNQGVRDELDAVYNLHTYLDEQRAALNAYADAITSGASE